MSEHCFAISGKSFFFFFLLIQLELPKTLISQCGIPMKMTNKLPRMPFLQLKVFHTFTNNEEWVYPYKRFLLRFSHPCRLSDVFVQPFAVQKEAIERHR